MKNNKWIVPFVGTVILGISSWALMTIIQLEVHIGIGPTNKRIKSGSKSSSINK